MPTESHSNPAIAHCIEASRQDTEEARLAGADTYTILCAGKEPYRAALPPLDGRENVRAFIACVAHGMLLNMFIDSGAKLLLYAAQVATSASRQPTRATSA